MSKNYKGGVPQRKGMNALERIRAQMEAQFEEKQRFQTDFLLQAGCDAFLMAEADVFHLGSGRAEAAINAYREYLMQIMESLIEDSKGDDRLEYFWEDLDRRLKQIVGPELFVPHDRRYDDTGLRIFTQLYRRTLERAIARAAQKLAAEDAAKAEAEAQ
jgi:hypothetical protein